ncbi:MAG: ABC transporter permease [Lachnospirales bacterium]
MTYSRKMKSKIFFVKNVIFGPLVAIILGLIVGALVIVLAGENPVFVYKEMFSKSFFTLYYLMQTLTRSTPVIVCSLATIVAWRAGYINLGIEGQMICGSLVATLTAIYLPGPPFLVLVFSIVFGMTAGAAMAIFAAFINDRFNVSIVISTLMMNYIATFITSYFVTFPFRDDANELAIQSKEIGVELQLQKISQVSTFNIGFFIVIFLVLSVVYIINKTNFGYESKMTGLNPVFAQYGGVKHRKVMYSTMALSGAMASIAGVLEIFGVKYRFIDGMFTTTSYAWTGLMSSLISALNPIGAFFTSIFLSGLQVGGQAIQRTTGIPLQVSTLIQATITLFVSVKIFEQYQQFKKKSDDAEKAGEL